MSHPDLDVTRSGRRPIEELRAALDAAGALPGTIVGLYRLIGEIGHGGMGTVYLAVRSDDAFHKRVAVKILKRGMDTDAIVRRFRNERQILASLEHPFIAGLFDGGTTPDGLPYFAMEYVEGQPISEYCESHRLDTTARLELFRKVCSAVHYAHQNLIVHRDIKPGNVLVTADGTPKLLDFGIAKLLNPELSGHTIAPTIAGPQLMTPEYASPEQVRGEPVTTASDVYSLGVLLYELLTGRRPYHLTSRAAADIANVICNSVPVRPSTAVTHPVEIAPVTTEPTGLPATSESRATRDRARADDPHRLRRRLAGDLDNIVLKALSKEPERRYASADQFSEDIRRHLAGLPVIARKDTLGYRSVKFVQRNRVAVVAAAISLVALVLGVIGTATQARSARRERLRAEQRFDDVRALANAALFELHDVIRDLEGSTPARQLLVSKGLEYLDKLAADAADRPDLKRELAGAYIKVGDVQGRPFNPNLGDTAGALVSYTKATALYESLGQLATRDPAIDRELATSYIRMSEVLSSTGGTADALSYARQALDLHKSIASAATAASDLLRDVSTSHSRVGDLLSATGDTSGALEHRRMALAMMERAYASAPEDPDNLRQLGMAHQKLGNSLGNPNYPNVGDYPGALEQLERATKVYHDGAALYPSNALFRRNIAVMDSNAADVLMALKREDEALVRRQRSLTSFQALSDADPANAAARNDVAISLSKIADMLDARGETREAVRQYERALAIHLALASADTGNSSMKLEVASDYNRLATAQAKLGDRTALENHSRALGMTRDLYAANPGNIELRVAVCLALLGRGDAYAAFGRSASGRGRDELVQAERDYVEALDMLTALQQQGVIAGTDVETLEKGRIELVRIREDLANSR